MEKVFQDYLTAGQMTLSNLLLANYRKLGLNETEFILILQIMSRDQQGRLVDLTAISDEMQLDDNQLGNLLRGLLERKFLNLTTATDAAGRKYDKYGFSFLYEKLFALKENELTVVNEKRVEVKQDEVYQNIEVEFGRLLTPIELETIDAWINKEKYSPELIVLALREAVLNQVYNLKYIDKILLSWEKQNIKTSADVERARQKRREELSGTDNQNKVSPRIDKDKPSIPMYDWTGGV